MKMIKRGAEADIFLMDWNGLPAILKARKSKKYRHPDLDCQIRRQRTLHESQIISLVKSFGIRTPLIYFLDTKRHEIIMQYIPGTLVRDLPDSGLVAACKEIGRMTGILHRNGIMHGDLTSSNFILSKNKIHAIDFGLAVRTTKYEDHAVDLRLFKEILNSAHAGVMQRAWKSFLEGYRAVVGPRRHLTILKLVAVIESRGRYATVV